MNFRILPKLAAALCIMIFFSGTVMAQGVDTADDSSVKNKNSVNSPFTFGGYMWVDNGYMMSNNKQEAKSDEKNTYQGGRMVFDITYRKEMGDFFAEAKGQLLAHVDELDTYKIDTLDSYIKFGTKLWDFQIGRYLGYEVYHKGQGLELYTDEDAGAIEGPDLYELDFARGRDSYGQAGFHLFPIEGLKIEIGATFGQKVSNNFYGVRPVIDYTIWNFQIVAGFEYQKILPTSTGSHYEAEKFGYGGRIQYNSKYITAGFNYAHGDNLEVKTNGQENNIDSYKVDSFGGFVDIDFWKNSIGLGCHYTMQESDRGDEFTHLQPFVSYLYRLPIDGLSIKLVLATAIADINNLSETYDWTNDMYSARIRIRYDFE